MFITNISVQNPGVDQPTWCLCWMIERFNPTWLCFIPLVVCLQFVSFFVTNISLTKQSQVSFLWHDKCKTGAPDAQLRKNEKTPNSPDSVFYLKHICS